MARRVAVRAFRAEIQYDALVDGNLDLVLLLDQPLHAFRISAARRRRTLVATVAAARHQGTYLLALDAPAGFCLLLDLAHHLASLLNTGGAASAPVATGCRSTPVVRRAGESSRQAQSCQDEHSHRACPHRAVSSTKCMPAWRRHTDCSGLISRCVKRFPERRQKSIAHRISKMSKFPSEMRRVAETLYVSIECT